MLMSTTAAIYLFILGGLCIYPDLKKKNSPFAGLIEHIQLYRVGLGMVGVLIGTITVVVTLLDLATLRWATFVWLLLLITGLLEIFTGIILSYDALSNIANGKNKKALELVTNIKTKLNGKEITVGYFAVIVAIISILTPLFFY